MWTDKRRQPEHYEVPEWARCLKVKPVSKVKVRKLEFILADALDKGYGDVITTGNPQSNHVRTTMLAAREVGLTAYCICPYTQDTEKDVEEGNLFLTRMSGCGAYFVRKEKSVIEASRQQVMDQAVQHIRQTMGRDCYQIAIGGSDLLGMYGYLDVYQELMDQGMADHVTDIVVTTSTGGTLAGLAIANYLLNRDKIKVHGYAPGLQESQVHINECLQAVGLSGVTSEDIAEITECRGLGYKINTVQELGFIKDVCKQTGVMLDFKYNGKAAFRMVQDLNTQPDKFKGNNILFIHTGGIYINLTEKKMLEFQNLPTDAADSKQVWTVWKPQL